MGDRTTVAGVDLLDLDRFQRGGHHEMFRRLRAETPVAWHDWPSGGGFWNVVKYADVVEVNRDHRRFSSEMGGVRIYDSEDAPEGEGIRGGC